MAYFIEYLHTNDFIMRILAILIISSTVEINIDYGCYSEFFWNPSTSIHRLYRAFHAYLVKSYPQRVQYLKSI